MFHTKAINGINMIKYSGNIFSRLQLRELKVWENQEYARSLFLRKIGKCTVLW